MILYRCVFISFGYIPRNGITELYGNSMFKLLKNCYTVFQSNCTILHPHSNVKKVVISLHPCQHFCMCVSCSVVSDCLRPHGVQPVRLLCPQDSPGKNTGVDCYFFLQGIFLIQGSNPGLLHYRQILYCLSHQGIATINFLSLSI